VRLIGAGGGRGRRKPLSPSLLTPFSHCTVICNTGGLLNVRYGLWKLKGHLEDSPRGHSRFRRVLAHTIPLQIRATHPGSSKAHRLLNHSTLGSRVIKKKKIPFRSWTLSRF